MFARETQKHWTWERELLALNAELLSALIIVTIKANSKQGSKLPKQLKIPRPGHTSVQAEAQPLSFGNFAAQLQEE